MTTQQLGDCGGNGKVLATQGKIESLTLAGEMYEPAINPVTKV